ncbi:DEAD/DEAH box helicase [Scytonema sp. UIC 10036]|uniref:DEAD/DEAH box helicase n=1 Tax=Scytonema sp. UIC 10036 TaxID=2304196 RepID=UPI001A9B503A|nr:DEAD/DEAH box helicase [Scytonema sp. UIC 10036]
MSNILPLAPGMRVLCRDAEWLVQRVEASNDIGSQYAVHMVGVDDLVRGYQAIFLTQLDRIESVDPRKTKLVPDNSNGFRRSKLFLEAQLRHMPATGEEPDLVGLGAFDPMPFQMVAVRRSLEQLRPRLLLADAVGLGKTIQVGMILTELMRRGRANRILVLTKKSMLTQFQAELWNRFAIPLVRLDSQGIAKLRLRIPTNKNPFEVYHRVIISIDTLKDVGRYRHFLEETQWDVVVIDEAHNVAGASVPENHLAHRLARLLSRRTDSMLLTTATPHNGKRETFGRLISLLDPSAIPDPRYREYDAGDIRGFYLMRFKEDVRHQIDPVGQQLSDRLVVPFPETRNQATEAEETAYSILGELREAVQAAQETAQHSDWRNQRLIQYGLYKQFLSSPESCAGTVGKRIKKLQTEDPKSPELPYLKKLEVTLKNLSLTESSRFHLLLAQLENIGWTGKENSPRILIFTEYVETQKALAVAIAQAFNLKHSEKFEDQPKQAIASISGACPDVHLMKTVEAFGTQTSPVRMMIATDVASEGINLHHQCHQVIHYDLPWSIITLIQRNGRIDRIGQTKTPILRYLMVETKNGLLKGDSAIFERLITKVEEINRSTRSGESLLQLYDPEQETEYIAEQGLLKGDNDVLEKRAEQGTTTSTEAKELELIISTANLKDDDDLLALLLSEGDENNNLEESASTATQTPSPKINPRDIGLASNRIRFYKDFDFLQAAYGLLQESDPKYLPIEVEEQMITLTAPLDLKRRLGAPSEKNDIIFGATAIPQEAWQEHDQFRLTDSVERVKDAITAARNTSGYWSKELLCSETHPIMQWLVERLLMEFARGEAPIVTSRELEDKELAFCFIGQVPSKVGTPLVVNAHAVCIQPGGRSEIAPLRDTLAAAGFERLANTKAPARVAAAELLISAAVEASLEHLRSLEKQRQEKVKPLLQQEEQRLQQWSQKRQDIINQHLAGIDANSASAKRLQRERDEMDKYLKDRQQHWRDMHLLPGESPITRLILVIEGVK